MNDEFYNLDGKGSVLTGLILLFVFALGAVLVFKIATRNNIVKEVGHDVANERLSKLKKNDLQASEVLAGNQLVGGQENVFTLPIDEAIKKVASLGKAEARKLLIQKSVLKDGKYEDPNKSSKVDLGDKDLIAKGKTLFQAKTCFTCHQVNKAIPSPAGMAIKAPVFFGDFWGKERDAHIGFQGPVQKVLFNEEYFLESVMKPMAKVAKGALAPMILAPGIVNDEEAVALMAYVKSLSKLDE